MRIHLTCDCGEQIEAEQGLAGLPSRCPSCGTAIDIPGLPRTQTSQPPHRGNGVSYDRAPSEAGNASWVIAALLLSIGSIAHAATLITLHTVERLHSSEFPFYQLITDSICLLIAIGLFKHAQAARSSAVGLAILSAGAGIVASFLLPSSLLPAGPAPLIAAAIASAFGWTALLGRRSGIGAMVVGTALVVLSWTMAGALWLTVRL